MSVHLFTSTCSLFSITAFQCNYAQHATTAVIRNSDVNSAPGRPSAHRSPWQLAQKPIFSWNLAMAFGKEQKKTKKQKKVNSCICCTRCENTSFIWCQRACVALSSVQIWVAASFLALSKHHRPPPPPPPHRSLGRRYRGTAFFRRSVKKEPVAPGLIWL